MIRYNTKVDANTGSPCDHPLLILCPLNCQVMTTLIEKIFDYFNLRISTA